VKKNIDKKFALNNYSSLLSRLFKKVSRDIIKITKKFFLVMLFVLKYCSLGVHYVLDYIFVTIIFSLLKKIYISAKTSYDKAKLEADKKYKNSNAYKQKQLKLEQERSLLLNSMDDSTINKRNTVETTYRYKVKDKFGKMKTGYMNALSPQDVMSFLTNEQYTVYSINTSKIIQFVFGRSSFVGVKMKSKELIFWLTQLSTYIKSGIPLSEAVKILSKQIGKTGNNKKIFDSLIYELTMGNSFSESMKKQKGVFPPLLINMLKAAEATGELEETLDDMANYYSEMYSTRKQMISAMTYPAIISVFAGGVVVFMIMYIIPKFTDIYDQIGAKITGVTKVVIDLSDFLQANITKIIFIGIIVIISLILLFRKVKFFRYIVQYILMRLPIVSKVIIYNELTIFTKTFASLLKNNVFITESMDILSKITNNEIYRDIMYNTISNIARGEKISESFKNHWAIPEVAYYMIVTGESTGELSSMMDKVSIYYQQEHRSVINAMKSFIEPIMIVTLAITVGTIIIAVIMPMFTLYGEIG